jgi:hypothetical protein
MMLHQTKIALVGEEEREKRGVDDGSRAKISHHHLRISVHALIGPCQMFWSVSQMLFFLYSAASSPRLKVTAEQRRRGPFSQTKFREFGDDSANARMHANYAHLQLYQDTV